MTGPLPLPPHPGSHGPPRHAAHPGSYPPDHPAATTGPIPRVPAGYPYPVVPYRRRPRWPLVLAMIVTLGLLAAVAGLIYAARDTTTTPLSDATAQTAIQGYLDALAGRDIDVIARNTLCGTYDAVADRRSDEALAKLSSDAFRKQFDAAEVTSVDKIVLLSDYQAQVLFTMRITPASGGSPRSGVQGTAQLLVVDRQVLVCSYVLRTGGAY